MEEELEIINFKDNHTTKKEKDYDPEIKYFCSRCEKETFPKYKRDFDPFFFTIFVFLIFASLLLLIIILLLLTIRRYFLNEKNKSKLKARDQLNFFGLVYPQYKAIICIECDTEIKRIKDKGDLLLVVLIFAFLIICFLYLRFVILHHL